MWRVVRVVRRSPRPEPALRSWPWSRRPSPRRGPSPWRREESCPEEPWLPVSRAGWLSREGVAALVTYLPVAALGLGWVFGEYQPNQITAGAVLSIVGAIIVLVQFGITINTMVLAGLAIAVGEVVDDAIIDVENIVRRLRENATLAHPRPAMEVILAASLEVRSAVVYATFIVALVFLPVLTMSGLQGRFFAPLGVAQPHLQSARLRPLGVTTSRRVPLLPTLPTIAESGLKGYESGNWFGLLVPAKTPRELVEYIRANAGKVNYATTSIGSPAYLGMEMFKYLTGVKAEMILYKDVTQAGTDTASGRVQLWMTLLTPSLASAFMFSSVHRPPLVQIIGAMPRSAAYRSMGRSSLCAMGSPPTNRR